MFMCRSAILASALVVAAVGSGCQTQSDTQGAKTDTLVVQASWLADGEVSSICSAIVEGFYREEGLDVELRPGGPAISFAYSSTILAQDEDVFVSIESALTEFVEGMARPGESGQLGVKAIGALWQDNPLGFLVHEDGPSSLAELFTGARPDGSPWVIGATPDAGLIEAIASHLGVSYDDLGIVTTGYDAAALLDGRVDALWAFWTTQAYEIEKAGIPYRFLSLSEIPGLSQPSMIVLTREDILRDKKDVLVRWFRATIRGAVFTVEDPERAAMSILDERCGGPDLDYDEELWLIRQSLPLYEYRNALDYVGYLDPEIVMSWTRTYLGIANNQNIPDAETLMDFSILEAIYGSDVLEAGR